MSITSPRGFRAAGVVAGLKDSGRPDLALVVNDGPEHVAAAVFTTNRVVGHPITWSRQVVTDGRVDAVVLNSGNANVCTGPDGFLDTHRTAEAVADALDISSGDVVVCSTGLIGQRLDIDTLLAGITPAVQALSADGGADAAHAIMTTDTVPKQALTAGEGWSVGGMAKGAGMLAPALATMLVVLTTDAVVDAETADTALRAATRVTFDRVDSDGAMSTSDTVVLLCSGASGVAPQAGEFTRVLTANCAELARGLVADAEGATHDIAVQVVGATTEDAAVAVGRAVTRSALVKTAIFGNDPNWGRILSQVGTVPTEIAPFEADEVDVTINGVMVCRSGGAYQPRENVELAANREVHIQIDLHAGDASATVWTNDLTHDYVHENSAYST
ncbi:MAG: bifunctional glutamate N-acetyltransferase/amino-acid acetyltransferase ArgJ [Beutenbergiaceae bacterium]